ncbi:MAG TPA: Gmad2 immunoglobulin-like domain-containing protein [Pseudogracilibacillus sp.]|nr:Gmad2 immunoglobulin-like domain-containing protein [Pseudogracilibacillus sp.]
MNKWFKLITIMFCLTLFTGCTINIGDLTTSSDDNESETEEEAETNANEDEQEDSNQETNQADDNNYQDEALEEDLEQSDTDDEEALNEKADLGGSEVVVDNEAFKVFEPAANASAQDELVIRGLARVFEATVQYSLEDGQDIIDSGFTTASQGGPEWGEFELVITIAGLETGDYQVVLYEASAEDNSPLHELIIPVHVIK